MKDFLVFIGGACATALFIGKTAPKHRPVMVPASAVVALASACAMDNFQRVGTICVSNIRSIQLKKSWTF